MKHIILTLLVIYLACLKPTSQWHFLAERVHFPSCNLILRSCDPNNCRRKWFSSNKVWDLKWIWTRHYFQKPAPLGARQRRCLNSGWRPCSLFGSRIPTSLCHNKGTKRDSSSILVHEDTDSDAFKCACTFCCNLPGNGQHLCKPMEFEALRCVSHFAPLIRHRRHADCDHGNWLRNGQVWSSMVVEVHMHSSLKHMYRLSLFAK